MIITMIVIMIITMIVIMIITMMVIMIITMIVIMIITMIVIMIITMIVIMIITMIVIMIITVIVIMIITMIVIMIITMIVIVIITMMVNYDRNHHHHNKYQLINVHHPPSLQPSPIHRPSTGTTGTGSTELPNDQLIGCGGFLFIGDLPFAPEKEVKSDHKVTLKQQDVHIIYIYRKCGLSIYIYIFCSDVVQHTKYH